MVARTSENMWALSRRRKSKNYFRGDKTGISPVVTTCNFVICKDVVIRSFHRRRAGKLMHTRTDYGVTSLLRIWKKTPRHFLGMSWSHVSAPMGKAQEKASLVRRNSHKDLTALHQLSFGSYGPVHDTESFLGGLGVLHACVMWIRDTWCIIETLHHIYMWWLHTKKPNKPIDPIAYSIPIFQK